MLRDLDYSPLTEPVDKAAARAYAKSVKDDPRFALWSTAMWGCGIVFLALASLSLAAFFVVMVLLSLTGGATPPTSIATAILLVYGVLLLGALLVFVSYRLVKTVALGGMATNLYRVTLFAERNGLTFSPKDPDPEYTGSPFTFGTITIQNRFTSTVGVKYDYGTANSATGNNSNTDWGYMALQLQRTTPHILLSTRSEWGALPELDESQRLSLEGDFDKYFALYCPVEYEQDALYIFTPDLMALMIDEASPFDVELLDGWIFFYTPSLDILKPETHERLLRIASIVGEKARSQTANYRDERITDRSRDVVASGGRRLKRKASPRTIIVVIMLFGTPFIAMFVGLVESRL